MSFEFSFYYALLGIALGITSVYLFGKLPLRTKFIRVIWTVWTIFSLLLPSGMILLYYLLPTPTLPLYVFLWQTSAFSCMVGLSLILYILCTLHPDRHSWLKGFIFWGLLWIDVVLTNLLNPETVTSRDMGAFIVRLPLYSLILILIGYIPIIHIGWRYIRKVNARVHKYHERYGRTYVLGLILLLFGYPASFILSSTFNLPVFGAFFLGILSLGTIYVGYSLARNQNILYLIPKMVIEVEIYHKSGVKLFSLHLRSDYQTTELKQGVIIALQGLFTDLLGTDIIQEIKLKDRHVLFMYNQKLGFIVTLVTVQIHRIMKLILQEISDTFGEQYQKELQECLDLNNHIEPQNFKAFEALTQRFSAI